MSASLSLFAFASDGAAEVRSREGRGETPAAIASVQGSTPAATLPVSDVWTPVMPAQAYREEQQRQIARVSGRIADGIRAFLRARGAGGTFYAHDLAAAVGGAPASADRVLRMLRNAGEVTYSVNRSSSLYTIETLSHVEAKP